MTTSTVVVGARRVVPRRRPGCDRARDRRPRRRRSVDRGWRPVAVWSTHGHWDHLLDGGLFTGLPRWSGGWPASTSRPSTAERDEDEELARVLRASPGDSPAPVAAVAPSRYPGGGRPARLARPGGAGPRRTAPTRPAARRSSCPTADVLVAGDLLSDVEIPLLDLSADDPVGDYRAALDLLAGTASLVVPGHGHVGPARRPARRRPRLPRRRVSPTTHACTSRGSRPCTSPSGTPSPPDRVRRWCRWSGSSSAASRSSSSCSSRWTGCSPAAGSTGARAARDRRRSWGPRPSGFLAELIDVFQPNQVHAHRGAGAPAGRHPARRGRRPADRPRLRPRPPRSPVAGVGGCL